MLPQSLIDLLPLLPSPAPDVPGVPTGVRELDVALPGGGLPRGRLTEVIGTPGGGQATLLRRIAEATIAHGGWVAYIDASRTLAPRDWAHLGESEGLWVIRPTDPSRAAWCADVLLRSSAFALLVLDSAPPLSHAVAVRLTRLARESSAALVVAGTNESGGSRLGGAVRLRVGRRTHGAARPRSCHPKPVVRHPAWNHRRCDEEMRRQLVIAVEKGGTRRMVEVSCAIGVARRLCTHPQVPDRRGVARGAAGRSGSEGRAASVALPSGEWGVEPAAGGPGGGERWGTLRKPHEHGADGHGRPRLLARKRRCAEPEYGSSDFLPSLRPTSHTPRRARALG